MGVWGRRPQWGPVAKPLSLLLVFMSTTKSRWCPALLHLPSFHVAIAFHFLPTVCSGVFRPYFLASLVHLWALSPVNHTLCSLLNAAPALSHASYQLYM